MNFDYMDFDNKDIKHHVEKIVKSYNSNHSAGVFAITNEKQMGIAIWGHPRLTIRILISSLKQVCESLKESGVDDELLAKLLALSSIENMALDEMSNKINLNGKENMDDFYDFTQEY